MDVKCSNISVFRLLLLIILQGVFVCSQELKGDIKLIANNFSEHETNTTENPPLQIAKLFRSSNGSAYNLKTSANNESENATNTPEINRSTISVPSNQFINITINTTIPPNIKFSNTTNVTFKGLPISQEGGGVVKIPVVKNDKIVSNTKDVPKDTEPVIYKLPIPDSKTKIFATEGGSVNSSTAVIPPKELAMEGGGSVNRPSSVVTSGTIATEGGSVDILSGTSKKILVNEMKSNAKKILDGASNLSKEQIKPSVTGRKGAIYKEAEITSTSLESSDILKNNSTHNDCRPTCCSNASKTDASNNTTSTEMNCTLCCDEDKLNGSGNTSAPRNISTETSKNKVVLQPNTILETEGKSSSNSESKKTSLPTNKNSINSFTSDTPTKKKPLITSDIDDLPTKTLPAEASTSPNNYVIPVIGIIFAIPLVMVLAMFLYKKGAEFWERRHYRRMDFLIDGMYND